MTPTEQMLISSYECSECYALRGEKCITSDGIPVRKPHQARNKGWSAIYDSTYRELPPGQRFAIGGLQ